MATLCPACQSEIPPGASSCPVCMRPFSHREMMRSFTTQKKEEIRRKRRPLLIAAGVILAGLAVWRRQNLQGAYQSVAPSVQRAVQQTVSSKMKQAQDAIERAESPQTYAPDAPRKTAGASAAARFPPTSPLPAAKDEPPAAAAPAQARESGQWQVSGQVFDLLSLKPITDAHLIFTAPDGTAAKARINQSGRYSIVLGPLTEGGYALTAVRAGKRADYLEEGFVPFQQEDAERRAEQARDAATAKVLHVPITVDESGNLVYNVALLPKRRK